MTKREAKRLSILKWEAIVENDGDPGINYPKELDGLAYGCGYCEKYMKSRAKTTYNRCDSCPLQHKRISGSYHLGCCQDGHPYNNWLNIFTKENAQAVLDLIIKS